MLPISKKICMRRSYLCAHPAVSTPSWRHFKSFIPLYCSITRVVPGNGSSVSVWFDSWTTLGPLADALPAAFSHYLAPAATLSDAVGAGPLRVPSRHRITPHEEAELSYLRAQLGALRLSPAPDRRVVPSARPRSSTPQMSTTHSTLPGALCLSTTSTG
jgi:hypothetical protein